MNTYKYNGELITASSKKEAIQKIVANSKIEKYPSIINGKDAFKGFSRALLDKIKNKFGNSVFINNRFLDIVYIACKNNDVLSKVKDFISTYNVDIKVIKKPALQLLNEKYAIEYIKKLGLSLYNNNIVIRTKGLRVPNTLIDKVSCNNDGDIILGEMVDDIRNGNFTSIRTFLIPNEVSLEHDAFKEYDYKKVLRDTLEPIKKIIVDAYKKEGNAIMQLVSSLE